MSGFSTGEKLHSVLRRICFAPIGKQSRALACTDAQTFRHITRIRERQRLMLERPRNRVSAVGFEIVSCVRLREKTKAWIRFVGHGKESARLKRAEILEVSQ